METRLLEIQDESQDNIASLNPREKREGPAVWTHAELQEEEYQETQSGLRVGRSW